MNTQERINSDLIIIFSALNVVKKTKNSTDEKKERICNENAYYNAVLCVYIV
jgi:hypothetical protein